MPARRREHATLTSFYVRLWLEENGETHEWRGLVRHVQSGELAYFVDVQDLWSFVASHGGKAFIQKRKEVNSNVVPHHAKARSRGLSD